jgi:two-component system sensor histidine kinase CiaH
MFRKLRMQLTIINLIIIATLFLILTTGTYLFAENQMKIRAENFSKDLIADIQTGIINDIPTHGPFNRGDHPPNDDHRHLPDHPPPDHPLIFFVKTTPDNKILSESSNQPLDSNQLLNLVQETLHKEKITGIIISQEISYFYFKAPLQGQSGMLLLFQNFEHEKSLLRSLITALIIIGILCLLLSLAASFYMANRAIIPIRIAWEQQKDFLADVSHELRTPLTVIQTHLEIVLDNQEETVASQNKWLHNMKEESEDMTKLVNGLLFLARADSQQQLIENKVFSLSQTISRTLEALSPLAITKGLQLNPLINPRIMFHGDEGAIKQLVGILFDNSIRHTPPGGKISVSLYESAQEIIFIFSDTGEGMEKKYLEKIFDRFYQIDKSRSKGGTGLGLSIAKLIVETHRGSIQVTSQPSQGTEFHITLPISF